MILGALLVAFSLGAQEALFNGKDLTGWNGDAAIFRVEDGAIVGGSLKQGLAKNAFLASDREFENFELTLEFKISGDPKGANAGVQIRSKRIPNDHEMIGYQADIGQGYWGCLYDESRRNRVLAEPNDETRAKAVKREDWNAYRIRCEGGRIQLWLNGVQTVDYTETEDGIAMRGAIGLQVHAGPAMEVRYRNIKIEELK